MERSRTGLLLAVGLAFFAVGGVLSLKLLRPGATAQPLPVLEEVGGDFVLTGPNAAPLGLRDFRGRVVLLFFGYTHCPDVCPTTLHTLKQAVEAMPPEAGGVQVIMITVDPERDTAEHLETYMRYFSPKFVGLTGRPGEIMAVARRYRVFFEKGEVRGENYEVGHSAYVYLIDTEGRVRAVYDRGQTPQQMAVDVGRLLADRPG